MEVFDAVRTVLAVRNFQDKPVPAEVVRQIVEAGRLTGSAMNAQTWHFIVVDDRSMLQKLGSSARTGSYTAGAAAAIVVVVEKGNYGLSDGSRAIQSMILTAWAAGVGSNWVGFYGLDAVKSLLGVPENLEVLAMLPLGYPVKEVGQGKKKRKPLSEVAYHGRFGQPYE